MTDPDVLMLNSKHCWIAFEYERWRKTNKRIYMAFCKHAQAIMAHHYHAVYFLFPRDADRAHYQALFDAPEWPQYKVNRQTGKITSLYATFKPDTVTHLRKCFRFIHEPADPTAH